MDFGVHMAYDYESVLEAATLAEKWGLASVVVPDHYLMSYDMETGWDLPAYDALVQLAGLARETSSVEIGTLVTPITFRHPAVLAKSAVTLDEMSGGRFKLGQYVHQRTLLERHARANSENVWNGRPISLIVLTEPLEVLDGKRVAKIELIPPVHQRVYRMGLEHLGVVVGEDFDEFSRVHRPVLTGQQFQSADVDPVYVLLEDFTHVKFYRRSFFDIVEDEQGGFEGFTHVDDWVPQRLVTATGPNPLPR